MIEIRERLFSGMRPKDIAVRSLALAKEKGVPEECLPGEQILQGVLCGYFRAGTLPKSVLRFYLEEGLAATPAMIASFDQAFSSYNRDFFPALKKTEKKGPRVNCFWLSLGYDCSPI